MPKFKIVYSVDGEERTVQCEGWRGIDGVLELLEVGTLYRLYRLDNDSWEFIQQSKTQAPKLPWGHEPFPD
jgi:hypothetical protein